MIIEKENVQWNIENIVMITIKHTNKSNFAFK